MSRADCSRRGAALHVRLRRYADPQRNGCRRFGAASGGADAPADPGAPDRDRGPVPGHLSGEDITAEPDGAAAMPLVSRQGGRIDWMQAAAAHPPLAALVAAYGLAPVEVGALLLVLAPESTAATSGFLPFSMMT